MPCLCGDTPDTARQMMAAYDTIEEYTDKAAE